MDEPTRLLPVQQPPARRFPSLAGRTVLVTCVVALVSVVVTAVIALPLATRATVEESRRSLRDRTDLVASYLSAPRRGPRARQAVVEELRSRGVPVVLIVRGVAYPDRLPQPVVATVAAQQRLSTTIRSGGRTLLVEGRPLGRRNGVVLTETLDTTVNRQAMRRLLLALLVGLLAGVAAGVVLARRFSLRLRRAAHAARRMSAGDRQVRLPVESPAELADLGHALNELNAALAASEDRQRRFLMSVSHELRTPLTTIRGYAEALADGVLEPGGSGVPPEADGAGGAGGSREAGRTMLAEAARLDRLVSDLLALARLQAQDFSVEVVDVDLTALVAEAATAWRPRCAEEDVELRTELPPTRVPAYTDPGRLRQVLDGLVENALRLVPAGAPIVLAVRAEPHSAVAEVRDGGPGLTDDDLAVAFEQGALHERYRRVRQVGSGLGLALAHGLVHRLGGRIEAGHAAEGGARFTVRLPSGGIS